MSGDNRKPTRSTHSQRRRLTRRNFIALGGAATAATTARYIWTRDDLDATPSDKGTADSRPGSRPSPAPDPTLEAAQAEIAGTNQRPWSDPSTWPDGKLPDPGRIASIDGPVVLDVDVRVAGLNVAKTGSLIFDPEATHTLTSTGNVVIHGRLEMRPATPDVAQTITFIEVDETAYVGGGMEPLDSDVGLWVMHDGVLDLMGTPRLGWGRAADALSSGATTIALADEPSGWRAGDEIVVTPTGPPDDESSEDDFEVIEIAAVSGQNVELRKPLGRSHPAAILPDGRVLTAEVLNLTRNVRIEGTPEGRAHVMVHGGRPQSIRFASFRHMGPRQHAGEFSAGVLGRYGLHFHICEDGSRGSIVDGSVVRDTGHHAFVPHTSHGISFHDCVSYDTYDDAYWWDQAPDNRTSGPPTDDLLYDRCVAALVRFDPPFRGYRLTGFSLSRGRGNIARGCVAVGVLGNVDASGFHWPEGSPGIWDFSDCIAHNCQNGIFVWHNTDQEHVIRDFVAYHNVGYGVDHGAYSNPYHYRDSVLYANIGGAVLLHATARDAGLRFTGLICDGAGRSEFLIDAAEHTFEPELPTRFTNCDFRGARTAAFGIATRGGTHDLVEVVDCRFDANEFWLGDEIDPASEILVRDATHGSIVIRRSDQDGELNPEWNARVSPAT